MQNEAIAKSFPATAMEGMYLRELQGRRTDSKKTGGFDCGKQAFIL